MFKSLIFKNTLYQFISRFFVVIISILTTYFLTRNFGVSLFGQYVFITSFALIFTGLSDLGSNILAVRDASFDKDNASKIFSDVFSFRIIFSLCLLFIYFLLVYILPQFNEIRLPALIAGLVIPFTVIKTSSQSVLQSKQRFDKSSALEFYAAILFLFLSIFFILINRYSLQNIVWVWIFSSFLTSIIGWLNIQKYVKIIFSFNKNTFLTIFNQALPLGLYFLVYSFYDRGVDSFFLKTFWGSQAVGYYGLSYKIYGNLILVAAYLMNSIFPIISSIKNDSKQIETYFQKTFSILLIFSLIVFFIFFSFSDLIVKLISGPQFMVSASILKILVIALFFSYLNHLCGYLLVALSEQKIMLKFSIFALIFNLVFNFIFIPYSSYWAAPIITVLTELVMLIFSLNYLKKKYGLMFKLNSFRILFNSIKK